MKTTLQSNDWLGLFLWTLDTVLNPSPRNILESFESWNYRNRLSPGLYQLRRAGFLERESRRAPSQWRLTEKGRAAAAGGIDPISRWSREWNGRWRLLLFDIPERNRGLRLTLRRWMKRQRFGCLQQSVWVTPDFVSETSIPLRRLKLTPESLTVIDGTPTPPDTHAGIVGCAWDFATINRKYVVALEVMAAGRKYACGGEPAEMRQWLADERAAWMDAIMIDPLLPEVLLPDNYLGQKAWRERHNTFSALATTLTCKN